MAVHRACNSFLALLTHGKCGKLAEFPKLRVLKMPQIQTEDLSDINCANVSIWQICFWIGPCVLSEWAILWFATRQKSSVGLYGVYIFNNFIFANIWGVVQKVKGTPFQSLFTIGTKERILFDQNFAHCYYGKIAYQIIPTNIFRKKSFQPCSQLCCRTKLGQQTRRRHVYSYILVAHPRKQK